jgi:hypothetical protein
VKNSLWRSFTRNSVVGGRSRRLVNDFIVTRTGGSISSLESNLACPVADLYRTLCVGTIPLHSTFTIRWLSIIQSRNFPDFGLYRPKIITSVFAYPGAAVHSGQTSWKWNQRLEEILRW